MGKLINEIGNKYGHLSPIQITKNKQGRTAWLCKCDCGNTKIVRGSDLRTNKVTVCSSSCPYKKTTLINEVGKRYGRLLVLYKNNKNSSNKTLWRCRCDCGNECDVTGENLRQGITISCGCYQKEKAARIRSLDLSQQNFGLLKAIKIIKKDNNNNNIWECECECGNIIQVPACSLVSENTMSCGCLKSSHGELKIMQLLIDYSIKYKREYSFADLKTSKNRKMRFDFAIFGNNDNILYLIEFDGQQHFQPYKYFGGEEDFQKRRQNDIIKTDYCLSNNIPLIRIPYTHLKQLCIGDLLLETSNFLVKENYYATN